MTVLAIDLSSSVGSLAIADKGEVIVSKDIGGKFEYDEKFVPTLRNLYKKAGIAKEDIKCIGVNAGPGSFTGIRIAIAAAKGIAFAEGIPVLDFNAMDIMLFQAYRETEDLHIVPVIYIKKNSYFAGVYRRNDKGGFKCIKKNAMVTLEEIQTFYDKGYTLYGYGIEEFNVTPNYPGAAALSLMTYQGLLDKKKPKKDIEPVYAWDFIPSFKRQYIK